MGHEPHYGVVNEQGFYISDHDVWINRMCQFLETQENLAHSDQPVFTPSTPAELMVIREVLKSDSKEPVSIPKTGNPTSHDDGPSSPMLPLPRPPRLSRRIVPGNPDTGSVNRRSVSGNTLPPPPVSSAQSREAARELAEQRQLAAAQARELEQTRLEEENELMAQSVSENRAIMEEEKKQEEEAAQAKAEAAQKLNAVFQRSLKIKQANAFEAMKAAVAHQKLVGCLIVQRPLVTPSSFGRVDGQHDVALRDIRSTFFSPQRETRSTLYIDPRLVYQLFARITQGSQGHSRSFSRDLTRQPFSGMVSASGDAMSMETVVSLFHFMQSRLDDSQSLLQSPFAGGFSFQARQPLALTDEGKLEDSHSGVAPEAGVSASFVMEDDEAGDLTGLEIDHSAQLGSPVAPGAAGSAVSSQTGDAHNLSGDEAPSVVATEHSHSPSVLGIITNWLFSGKK